MNINIFHPDTNLQVSIHNDSGINTITGDAILVEALTAYLDNLKDSFIIKGDIEQAIALYGEDLMIRNVNLWSVDTGNVRYLYEFLIPHLHEMGYSVEVLAD